ncbi:biliverdin-producing heme oxygenase [Terriglobus aquaticus]|uniref:Biliverdin-producing heme oxygenase n=1 Tax=Terriglobus aquaticus TaxID=940139 RepID=A0ABW9KQ82_9BACT|nr:biliverdin-producing heme oxygenase [Terriglobus aquaticus]
MDAKLLREATRPEHEATEAMVPLMHPDLTRAEYVVVLQRFYEAIRAWEAVAARRVPPAYADLVRQRSRRAALEADLRFFQADFRSDLPAGVVEQIEHLLADAPADAPEQAGRFLGAMYVVEGSTLGGQYIASHVESVLGLTAGEGTAFFRGYGSSTVPKWREFQRVLMDLPDIYSDEAIGAAKEMFGVFRRCLSKSSEADQNALFMT